MLQKQTDIKLAQLRVLIMMELDVIRDRVEHTAPWPFLQVLRGSMYESTFMYVLT